MDRTLPVSIEGYLKKYTNSLKGFCRRFFILRGEILEYYITKEDMGKKKPKRISLACADILPKKGKEMKINSGLDYIHIKFETMTEKLEWVDELRKA